MSRKGYKHRLSMFERAKGVWDRYREVKQGLFGLFLVIWFFLMAMMAPVIFPLYPGILIRVGPDYGAPQWMSWTSPDDLGNHILNTPAQNFLPDPFFDYDNTWVINDSSPQASWHYDYSDYVASTTGENRSLVLTLIDDSNNETYRGESVYAESTFEWEYLPSALAFLYYTLRVETTGNLTDNGVLIYYQIRNDNLWDSVVAPNQYTFTVYPTFPRTWASFRNIITSQVMNRAFLAGEEVTIRIYMEFQHVAVNADQVGSISLWSDDIQLWGHSHFWGSLGTSDVGQDVMAQLFWGAQVSLFIGIVATFIGVAVGLLLGLAAGYFGGAVDEAAMRVTDFFIIMPTLPIMMILSAILNPSLGITVFVIALFAWPGPARVIRSQVLVEKEKAYVEAARAAGAGDVYLVFRHVFPNVLTIVFVQLATGVSGAILSEAGLSFLGLTPQNLVSWGRMLQAAYNQAALTQIPPAWWFFIPPGLCIALLSMGFIFIGYAVDKALNPRLRRL
ncbi:MAG: ABC transporter permease [Candidatus Hermodarchaeia archaeon]